MVILIAHGSRDPRWRSSVERVVDALQRDVGPDMVRLAYMDITPPTLLEVAAEAVAGGVGVLRILPLFLADEGHVERDIQPLVEEVRRTHPGVHVEQLPAVGQAPEFVETLAAIARRTEREEAMAWRDTSWESEARPRPGRWGWWAP